MGEVYWRIQRDAKGKYHVCCLQDFDEHNYDEQLWVYAMDKPMKFSSEKLASRFSQMLESFETQYGPMAALKVVIYLNDMYDGIKEEPTNPFEGA